MDLADNNLWRQANDADLLAVIREQRDVNAGVSGQHTLLHYACGYDRSPEVIAELLRRGANPNATNHNGNTPLHLTAQRGSDPRVVVLLLETGARMRVHNDKGETPLDTAIDCANWVIAQQIGEAQTTSSESDLAERIANLGCSDYRYLDAIYFREGIWDRQIGHSRRPAMTVQHSIWLGSGTNDGLADKIIMAFETTRPRPFEQCAILDCTTEIMRQIRDLHQSDSHESKLRGQSMLIAMILGRSDSTIQAEIILGRPYWELTLALTPTADDIADQIDQSVGATASDIIAEATDVMERLGLWAYNYWISETELMVAAGLPMDSSSPQNRGEYERRAPLLTVGPEGSRPIYPDSLMEWSNNQRSAHEPGISWDDIRESDKGLIDCFMSVPALRELLDGEAHSPDGVVLIHRLVRLGKFGYGNPIVR